MTSLESIIQDFSAGKAGNLTHRRPFLNTKSSTGRMSWYARRRFA